MTRRRYPEWELSCAVAEYLAVALRDDAIAFCVPNQRASAVQRRLLAAAGVLPGVADWMILQSNFCGGDGDNGHAYALELKVGHGRLSPAQVEFKESCRRIDVPYAVVRSIEDVHGVLYGWNLLKPGVMMLPVARRSTA